MSKRVPLAVIALVCIAGILWFFLLRAPAPPPLVEADYALSGPLIVKHSRADTLDTYRGSLPIGGCLVLSSGLISAGTSTPRIILALKTLEPREPCETPSAEPLAQDFEVSRRGEAPAALAGATINNQAVDYRLQEE